jgi:hypothetical protein
MNEIACTLTGRDLSARLREIAALGRSALRRTRREDAHAELRFAASDGIRDRVEAVVAAESACCGFLSMRVTESRDEIVLTIDTAEGGELVLHELVDAFEGKLPAA